MGKENKIEHLKRDLKQKAYNLSIIKLNQNNEDIVITHVFTAYPY